MSLFHRAKHWQLFTILIGTIFILQITMMLNMASQIEYVEISKRPPNMAGVLWLFFPMMLIPIGIIFGWQWSIGWGLKDKVPHGVRLNHKLFKGFTLFPIIYFLVFMTYMMLMVSTMESLIDSKNPFEAIEKMAPFMFAMILFIPLHLFAMFSMFYGIYFCAKTLRSIEMGREAELNDYIGYFFLFLFNIVGIWIIQPSVNRITSGNWTPPLNSFPNDPLDGIKPIAPTLTTPSSPTPKEVIPRGEKLKTKNHDAFNHDDDFDGIL